MPRHGETLSAVVEPDGFFAERELRWRREIRVFLWNTRLSRRRTRLLLGGGVATALVVGGILIAQGNLTKQLTANGWPLTEVGGGGALPPLKAVNDVWGLSQYRSTCTMCHQVRPHAAREPDADHVRPFRFNSYGAAYRRILFGTIAPNVRGGFRIFRVTQGQREAAARWPAVLSRDSDGDGFSNEIELMFGSMPGRPDNHPSRPAAQLEQWRLIIARELRGRRLSRLERDARVRRVGPDSDGDRVPDVLELFAGWDPRNRSSTPLVAARRLAVYRQLVIDAGVSLH
jgi:hypothetical protein